MNSHITHLKPILSPARKKDVRDFAHFNGLPAAFRCALVILSMLAGAGVSQAQQPVDPLTITRDGNVGIGTPPANKLSVAGNADVSGAVGIGTTSLGTSKFKIANSPSDFAHFRFDKEGAGEFEFVGWADGWNINSKTAGKNLYLNRDANTNSDVLIGRSGNEMIVKGDTGKVGIGTTPLFGKLQVAGGSTTALRLDANSGVAAMSIGGTGQLIVDAPGVTGGRFIVKDDGNVGIGTNAPTQAKLVVNGGVANIPVDVNISYFSEQDSPGRVNRFGAGDAFRKRYLGPNVSIYASGNIWSGYSFVSSSDERIKNIHARSDSATDLRTLLGIEVTDYRYKDVIGRGNNTYKKVIGQQVEKVFPQAVSKQIEVVPDIYQQASIQDGWIALATDLKRGERVKLITAKGEEGAHEVLEVAPGKFRIDFKPEGNKVFVYGREVKDFLTVDYGAISMLNVSATQQIKKEKDEEVKALQAENAVLRSQLAQQEKRLAAIEALLLSGDKPAVRSASLKKRD